VAGILKPEEIDEIIDFALDRPISRDLRVRSIPIMVLQRIRNGDDDFEQLTFDVDALNIYKTFVDGILPIERWLRNSARASRPEQEAVDFYTRWAQIALERAELSPVAPSPRADAAAAANSLGNVVPQKVLWTSDLLPISFLNGAARTAASVARITVTRYEGDVPKISPASGQPIRYFGTGWLIGKGYIITNHHVVNARSPGEANASMDELNRQAMSLEFQFDYDDANRQTVTARCARLCISDPALDFAIIELPPPEGDFARPPLPLSLAPIVIDQEDSYFPVNIIQHPGGNPKQIAIRNNLAVRLDGANLSYFTDTQAGSSGSPVCNDSWAVIALHKAAVQQKTNFTFQGQDTPWINIGTPISMIVERLKGLPNSTLWRDIAADIQA
jgi:endonuclease G, mitochondrial